MPEINSVAGQLVGIPVGQVYTAGKGVVIDNVNKTVRVDETELWSTTNGSSTGNLSEPATNFEKLRFYWNYNENGSTQAKTIIDIPVDASFTRYFLSVTLGQTYCYLMSIRVDFSNNFGTFTAQNAAGVTITQWGGGGTVSSTPSTNVNACKNGIYKIVGINRIAGGN